MGTLLLRGLGSSNCLNRRGSFLHAHSSCLTKSTQSSYPKGVQLLFRCSSSSSSSSSSSQPGLRGCVALFYRFRRGCVAFFYRIMGQVLDRMQGKQWRQRQIRKITDKIFDHFKNETGRATLNFEDLYIGVLLVYNDINKRLPGPHFDPPSKEKVRAIIQENDINLDGEIDREEFAKVIKQITADTFIVVSQGLILTLVAAPAVAIATKKATEGVPGIGKVVQRLPNAVYASLLTLAVVFIQQASQEF